jgi:simple sugar transport system permease protein
MRRLVEGAFPSVAAVVAGLLIGAVVILAAGDNPLEVYSILFGSAFGSLEGLSYTLFFATPLIFTGLAVGLGFRAGLFNIGAEGQLHLGAFAAVWVALTFAGMPGIVLVPACILAAALAGGVWGWIPGALKARFGIHEVINTIMMNFIAIGFTNYLVTQPYRAPGDQVPQTLLITESARIPRLSALFPWLFSERSGLNAAFFLAILMCVAFYLLFSRTKLGFEIRATGLNTNTAKTSGINVARITALSMALSGALAGLVGVHEVLGHRYRFFDGFSPGYGFLGIAVALLGRNHPAGIVLASIFFGGLVRGGIRVDVFSENVSKDVVLAIEGIIMIALCAEQVFRRILPRSKGVVSCQ